MVSSSDVMKSARTTDYLGSGEKIGSLHEYRQVS